MKKFVVSLSVSTVALVTEVLVPQNVSFLFSVIITPAV